MDLVGTNLRIVAHVTVGVEIGLIVNGHETRTRQAVWLKYLGSSGGT